MANPWTRFLDLLPSKDRWVGKVVSAGPSGKIFVEYPGSTGSNILVDGDSATYVTDDYVFIEGGTIVSKAPDLKLITNEMVTVL